MKSTIQIFLFYFLVEFLLFLYIKKISKKNKWVLLDQKLHLLFNKERFNFFKKNNYNYGLGWDKKSNSVNFDVNNKKKNILFY